MPVTIWQAECTQRGCKFGPIASPQAPTVCPICGNPFASSAAPMGLQGRAVDPQGEDEPPSLSEVDLDLNDERPGYRYTGPPAKEGK
jgi:hypothetical protein